MGRTYRRRDFFFHLVERTVAEFLDDRCPQLAASISYHALFSLFPLAIVSAAVFGLLFHDSSVQNSVVDAIVRNAPLNADGASNLRTILEGATGSKAGLGLVALAGLVWASSGLMTALRTALNAAWDVEQPRPWLKGKLIDLGLVAGVGVLALASFALTLAAGAVGDWLGFAGWLVALVPPFALAFTIVLGFYRVLPDVRVRLEDAWPPAALVAAAFVLLQLGFSFYLTNFGKYNAVYGSLGAIIAFMFFVYLSSYLFLLGAEAAAELPRARKTFRTGGPPPGPPFSEQVKDLLRGLWVRKRQQEAEEN